MLLNLKKYTRHSSSFLDKVLGYNLGIALRGVIIINEREKGYVALGRGSLDWNGYYIGGI